MSQPPSTENAASNAILEEEFAIFQKKLEELLQRVPSIMPPSLAVGTSRQERGHTQARLKQIVVSVMAETLMEMERKMESSGERSTAESPDISSSVHRDLPPISSSIIGTKSAPPPSFSNPATSESSPSNSTLSKGRKTEIPETRTTSQTEEEISRQTAINTTLNMGPRAKVKPRPPLPDVNYGKLGIFAFREPCKPILFNASFLPVLDSSSKSGKYQLQRSREYIRVDRGFYIEFLPPDMAPGPNYRPDYRPLYPGAILIPPRSKVSTELYEFPTAKPPERLFFPDPNHRKDMGSAFKNYAFQVKRHKHYLISYSHQMYEPAKPMLYHPLYLGDAGIYYNDKPPAVVRDMGRYLQLFHPEEKDIPNPATYVPDYEAPFEHLHLIPSLPGQHAYYTWPTEPLAMYAPPPEDEDLLAQAEMYYDSSNSTISDAPSTTGSHDGDIASSLAYQDTSRKIRVRWLEKVGVRVFNDSYSPPGSLTSSAIFRAKRAREEDGTTDDSQSTFESDSADGDSRPQKQKRKLSEHDSCGRSKEESTKNLKDTKIRRRDSDKNKLKKQERAWKAAKGTMRARDYEKVKLANKLKKRGRESDSDSPHQKRKQNDLENNGGFFSGLKYIISNVLLSGASSTTSSRSTLLPEPISTPRSSVSPPPSPSTFLAPSTERFNLAMPLIKGPRPLRRQDTTVYDFSTLIEAGNSEQHQSQQLKSETNFVTSPDSPNSTPSSPSPGSRTLPTIQQNRMPRLLQRHERTIRDFGDAAEVVEYERIRQEQRSLSLSTPYQNDLQVTSALSQASPSTTPASSIHARQPSSSPSLDAALEEQNIH